MRQLQQAKPKLKTSKRQQREDQIIDNALDILYNRIRTPLAKLTTGPDLVDFLKLAIGEEEREVFIVLYLDTNNQIIWVEEAFQGTIRTAAVHPREIVKQALQLNAGAVIFCHNHLSGDVTPSDADRRMTRKLIRALVMFEIVVMDHIIISGKEYFSFERVGLLDVLKTPVP
jgi:DNA repair protein RadC